jgi:putative ABC transport system permease protein
MNFLRQFLALLRMNLEGERARLGSVLTIIIGVTCTVAVLVSMLAMGTGARQQAAGAAHDDEAVVVSQGAQGNFDSNITRDQMVALRDLPGIDRDKDGEPRIEGVVVVPFEGHRRGSGRRVFFPMLGISDAKFELRPPAHLTEGRMFRPGLHEIVTTNACVTQFEGFELGAKREVRGADWMVVVGHYDQGGNMQCVVLTDAETLMGLFNRNAYNRVNVRLKAPSAFATFDRALEANPALKLEARPAPEQAEADMRQYTGLLNFVSYFIGAIMAIGATFGAVNSLYSIVDARRRELATLRAIGFGSLAIVAATLVESILLALPGALLGAAIAWLLFHGMAVSPGGFPFRLDVTPRLAEIGILWALVMGFVGGLLPAERAARVPITTALRAT